jgi:hypothetical protein
VETSRKERDCVRQRGHTRSHTCDGPRAFPASNRREEPEMRLLALLGLFAVLAGACGSSRGEETTPITSAPGTSGEAGEGETAGDASRAAGAQDGLEFLEVELESESEATVSGLAKLRPTEDGEHTQVLIRLRGGENLAESALVHDGSCDELGDPVFTLNNVKRGRSRTRVASSFDQLRTGGFSIAIHPSAAAFEQTLACGEIVGEAE